MGLPAGRSRRHELFGGMQQSSAEFQRRNSTPVPGTEARLSCYARGRFQDEAAANGGNP